MPNEIEERLNSYQKVITAIHLKQSYLAELKDRRGLKASIASEVHANHLESIDEKITNDIIDIEREIEGLEEEAVNAYDRVMSMINLLDNDLCKRVLYARFINFKSWDKISYDIGYSLSYIRGKLYKNSLNYLEAVKNI